MKNYGIPLQYACFECRKSFKRKQFSATYNRYMTSDQQAGQKVEAEEFSAKQKYKCPDCGGITHFMGQDFKAPKKSDIKGWLKVKKFIESGKNYYRSSQGNDNRS